MGALFRSEEMSLIQLFIQPEAAYHIVSELGEIGCFQFRDLSEHLSSYSRQFVGEVRRCEEMEKQLRYIESELKKEHVRIKEISDAPRAPNPRGIVELEVYLEKTEKDIHELSDSSIKLKENFVELTQMKHLLEKAQHFFATPENFEDARWTAEDIRSGVPLKYVAGVIDQPRFFAFERMLWRIGRGNIYIRHDEIAETVLDPRTGIEKRKIAFIAFFQGAHLQNSIDKVCNGFHATIYECPNAAEERRQRLIKLGTEVADIQKILNQLTDHRRRILGTVAKELENWTIMVFKMKAIYHTMNLFAVDVSKKCMIGEGWVPKGDIQNVQNALTQGAISCGSSVPSFLNIIETKEVPPTYNRQTKFTQGFQNLISSYGMATYLELNPALYTIITFPFLFAVMFGDLGHGIILFLAGLYLVLAEKKLAVTSKKSEILGLFFSGRYIVLLMGIFSMYTGFIYNDLFSKSLNLFGPKWKINKEFMAPNFTSYTDLDENTFVTLLPRIHFEGSPYLAGVDPVWNTASNKIIFLNSFKMKLSIIFGVVHMIFGICLSTINFIYLKKKHALFLDFLPKILFFTLLFGYMMFMTFFKYIAYSGEYDGSYPTDPIQNTNVDTTRGSSCAPSVLIYFIDMMLVSTPPQTSKDCPVFMFSGQNTIQNIFLIIALLCIPTMLLGTPIYEIILRKKKPVRSTSESNKNLMNGIELNDVPKASTSHDKHDEHEEEPMSEVWVHAGIHTIEFTLSTVSHTASYLRLWALSLAHAQLSEVLWQMVFQKGLVIAGGMGKYVGSPVIFIVFAMWAFLTLAILVLMEGLSAFLHTLRLHWVEFMTKFYEGLGYAFEPFSFQRILDGDAA